MDIAERGTESLVGGAGALIRPLSAEDLSILALESETVAGHTCKVIVTGTAIDPGQLRASIAARVADAPILQMRLAEVDAKPCWVRDAGLDLDAHVVVDDYPEPLDKAALGEAVARIFEQRLDRSRPLWQMHLLPRLAAGGSALVWKVHHAVADGSTVMRTAKAALWDQGPVVTADVSAPTLAPMTTVGAAAAVSATPSRSHRLGEIPVVAREMPHPWQRSPLGGHISARRTVAFASVELGELRRIAHATEGATVNDVVLTVVAGGLRRWIESTHGHIGAVRVKVPVSLHGAAAAGDHPDQQGNRDSFFCLELPLQPADPLARLRVVSRATRIRKREHDAQHVDALMRELGQVPSLRRFAERILSNPRAFALNVSNVPGPREPVKILGAPVLEMYSLAEIGERHALRIAVVSLADTLSFGITADSTLLPGIDKLADYIREDVAELVASASNFDGH